MAESSGTTPSGPAEAAPSRHITPLVKYTLYGFAVFELLNLTNICYRKLRYLSEAEFINIAIQSNLKRYQPNEPDYFNKAYASLEDFHAQNPHCCRVMYFTPDVSAFHEIGVTPLTRLICVKDLIVNVYYKANETYYDDQTSDVRYYYSVVRMNSCGDILGSMGIQETLPPPQH
jgi:hypothetical protein